MIVCTHSNATWNFTSSKLKLRPLDCYYYYCYYYDFNDAILLQQPFPCLVMDDGVLAGPRQSLCQALDCLQVHGPALGLHVNLSKCELFSLHNLDVFPSVMKAYDKPNIEILGFLLLIHICQTDGG